MADCRRNLSMRPTEPMCERIDRFPVAMAYVPWQAWNQTYELETALCEGTIFPELNQPFCGKRGGCHS